MKTIKNAPFYLVIVAVVKEQFKNCSTAFKVGEEWVVEQSCIRTPGYDKANEIFVKKRSSVSFMGYEVFKVEMDKFDFKVKTIVPNFKVGDIVIRKDAVAQTIASRVSSYSLSNGTVWYQDEWGDSQGLASGNEDAELRLATPSEIKKNSWALERKYEKV